jgi:hypothetical protein
MRLRSLAVAALALSAAGPVLLAPARAAAPAQYVVRDTEAGRMTRRPKGDEFQADTTIEPSIAVNPANPRNAVVGYQAGRADGAASNGYGVTFDAGRHWTYGLMPKLTGLTGGQFTAASDPVIAFGPKNTVYYSSLAFNADTSAIVNHTSHDGGRHWDAPTYVLNNPGQIFNDKNWVVVDNGTGLGHHTGRVYVLWDVGEPVLASYSDDQGKTWLAAPSVVYPGQGIGTIPLVLGNGDLAVVFATNAYVPPVDSATPPDNQLDTTTVGRMVVATAHGAGALPTGAPLTFSPPVTVGSDRGHAVQDLRAGGLPSASVDPKTGLLAVTWEDGRYRKDAQNDVVVTTSSNGVTWSVPKRVNRGGNDDQVDHFTPALAFGADGVLRIAYRQRPNADDDEKAPYVDTYFQQSSDGGKTWSTPLRVNRVRTDLRFAAFSRNAAFLGDYMQVAPAGAFTYIVRCEALHLSPRDKGSLPPDETHHQRTYVAVVGPRGKTL